MEQPHSPQPIPTTYTSEQGQVFPLPLSPAEIAQLPPQEQQDLARVVAGAVVENNPGLARRDPDQFRRISGQVGSVTGLRWTARDLGTDQYLNY